MENPYLELTAEFNRGRLRAVVSSGQAVVLHKLAVMSKDGDWILRHDQETCEHVLGVLAERQARYRFGAPLDCRWLAGGWSSHLEHRRQGLRLRTDFVTHPPRVLSSELARLWQDVEQLEIPVVGLESLAALKKTNREKDYAVIGDLARLMAPRSQLLHSRSARDLIRLAEAHPELLPEAEKRRPLLAKIPAGRDELERTLDEERRSLMRANERRLAAYREAGQAWSNLWPEVAAEISGLPLLEAHRIMVTRAERVLPVNPEGLEHG